MKSDYDPDPVDFKIIRHKLKSGQHLIWEEREFLIGEIESLRWALSSSGLREQNAALVERLAGAQASGFAQGIEAAAKLVRAQPIHSDFPLDMEIALLLAKKIDALKPPEAK